MDERKYEDALKRAKDLLDDMDKGDYFASKADIENIFPELQESEDERIRKGIIRNLQYLMDRSEGFVKEDLQERIAWLEKQGKSNTFKVPETSIKAAEEVTSRMQYIEDDMKPIAEFIINYANWDLHKDEWNQPTLTVPLFRVLDALIQRGKLYGECVQNIEKQGENEPTDKVKPKFKVGDWILNNVCFPMQIASIKDGMYIFTKGDAISVSFIDENYHLWTIHDAMDGDVLVNGSNIFIFHFFNSTRLMGYCHVNIDNGRFYDDLGKNECFCLIDAVVNPATKEQRDLLFQKMKEAGYEWDSEKKELKKIEVASKESEDERIREQLCDFLRDNMLHQDAQYFISWLEAEERYCRTCKHRRRYELNEYSSKVVQCCDLQPSNRSNSGYKTIKVTDLACGFYEPMKGGEK